MSSQDQNVHPHAALCFYNMKNKDHYHCLFKQSFVKTGN